jgi:hypothetical protein
VLHEDGGKYQGAAARGKGALEWLLAGMQFMKDIVKPASKDAGGHIQGTVTDLKEQVSAHCQIYL